MKLVLSDIEEPALDQAAAELREMGASVLPVHMDVSKPDQVEALAKRTLETFGAVHLLINNAGVGSGGAVWGTTLADWQWVLGVNLWGVIYGCHTFLPIMLQQGTEGHVVNTASIAGLLNFHFCAPYQVSKHAVVALSENIYHSLAQIQARVKVSVLCPGWIQTRIMESERNRPAELRNPPPSTPPTAEEMMIFQSLMQEVQSGLPASAVSSKVFEAIEQEAFYILTEERFIPGIQERMDDIVHQRIPKSFVPQA
jgi:NAD(P)-dependent dehydrogenase (short-subunit alcohol dehydrogenase family)